ncbi:hypothetical protein [Pleurocapsa sp. PCC 7327]|uniref:hypothetical protein n=1 Tax=Pleurocapsa sp. PCC 7327 TaxID=118163 RepID=UPI0002EEA460|nr:hypothetical protein [Pleurocapsa sp. PCC 7327]
MIISFLAAYNSLWLLDRAFEFPVSIIVIFADAFPNPLVMETEDPYSDYTCHTLA